MYLASSRFIQHANQLQRQFAKRKRKSHAEMHSTETMLAEGRLPPGLNDNILIVDIGN